MIIGGKGRGHLEYGTLSMMGDWETRKGGMGEGGYDFGGTSI